MQLFGFNVGPEFATCPECGGTDEAHTISFLGRCDSCQSRHIDELRSRGPSPAEAFAISHGFTSSADQYSYYLDADPDEQEAMRGLYGY